MRSWIKKPIILKNKDDMSIVFLFKTMVYDYVYADLDPIEMNDLIVAISNAEMISDRIQYIAGEIQ